MNKIILFFLVVVGAHSLQANTVHNEQRQPVNQFIENGISFVENGVRFRVFLNGEFNFDRRSLRDRRNTRRLRINRDFLGRVRRVGNVSIGYDLRGRVRRIGSIRMNYRRGLLTRVGNLKIVYNRRGNYTFYGRVRYNDFHNDNYIDDSYPIYDFNNPFFFRRDFRNFYAQYREDHDFIYYRALRDNGDVRKGSIIKREKKTRQNTRRKRGSRTSVLAPSRN